MFGRRQHTEIHNETEVQGVISFQVCLEKCDSIKSFTKGKLLTFKSWLCYTVNTENVLYFEEYVLVVSRKISTLCSNSIFLQ